MEKEKSWVLRGERERERERCLLRVREEFYAWTKYQDKGLNLDLDWYRRRNTNRIDLIDRQIYRSDHRRKVDSSRSDGSKCMKECKIERTEGRGQEERLDNETTADQWKSEFHFHRPISDRVVSRPLTARVTGEGRSCLLRSGHRVHIREDSGKRFSFSRLSRAIRIVET